MGKIRHHFIHLLISICEALNGLVWKLKRKSPIEVKVINNDSIKVGHYGDIAKILYSRQFLVKYDKSFEYTTLTLFKQFVKPDAVILDIGANIGLFSLLADKWLGADGKVIAFEPSAQTFQNFKKNLEYNNVTHVVPYQVALSDKEGKAYLSRPTELSNRYQYQDAFSHLQYDGKEEGEMIQTRTIDNILQENQVRKVDLIKIDVEGAELMCFKGATGLLSSANPPVIIMESNEHMCKKFGYSSYDTLNFLHSFGYTFEQYEHGQWLALPSKQ